MSESSLDQENIAEEKQQSELNSIDSITESIAQSSLATILCKTKKNNPNYLPIIFANEEFYKTFDISKDNLIGKSYDFLFSDLEIDYSSEDQGEYVRLIKSVKDSQGCSVSISISDRGKTKSDIRFKITFAPFEFLDEEECHYVKFSFEKFESEELSSSTPKAVKSSSVILLKNLERTLRNERILREIASLIVSDYSIQDIADKVSKILCEHLRADRCIIHDYQNSKTNFVVESCGIGAKPMLADGKDTETLRQLAKYINFQNHFFERYGDKDKKSSLMIIEDIASDNNFIPIQSICKKFSISSQIAITTTFNDKVNGGIYIHQSDRRNWMTDEIELVEMIADQFSIAVDRSESIERVMIANHALMEKTSQLKDALRDEQEMRQIQNEFVALVSHEFKTPLQIIDSTREVISRKIKSHNINDESISRSLDKIKAGIQRMNGLIHSTLNLAKIESGNGKIKLESQIFDLKKFVREIIEKNANLALNKNIKIIVKIDALPEEFNGDPKLLDHSVTNIISNAIKYSKDNSTVKIMAKSNDKKVALRVVDQGIGIPKDDLSNIGQKFFRAKNTLSVAGTGIGLYLAKHFVELHGGNIAIESEVNVGTAITATLPR